MAPILLWKGPVARLLVPVALFTLAFLVMRVAGAISRRRRMRAAAQPKRSSLLLIHSINDDRCTGCEACVNVCPTDVLELQANHARPARFDDCIQCNQCEWVCPTKALVMHPPKEQPPKILLPALDEFYQTNIRGLYLIGEAGGKPLTKNASNLGRAAVEHMRSKGLRASNRSGMVDVLIIGSGPGGLSAALTCMQHGLSYACIDKEKIPFSTVARYPKGKWVMAEPYDVRCLGLLPIWDAPKDDIVREWSDIVAKSGVKVDLEELVQGFKGKEGDFQVVTSKRTLRAQRMIIATGTRGKPRKLKVSGEDLPKVANLLDDPDDYRGKDVLIVGGGDSAAEAVIALVEAGARVTLSYRGKQIVRANPKNREKVEKFIATKKVTAYWSSQVTEIGSREVAIKLESGRMIEVQNDAVITLIGADPPIEWLKKMGIEYVERPHMHAQPKSDELLERLLGDIEETTRENVYQMLGIESAPRQKTRRSSDSRPRRMPEQAEWRQPERRMEEEDVERLPVIQARVIPLRRGKASPPPLQSDWSEPPQRAREEARSGGFFDEPTRTADPDEIIAAREMAAREQSEVELRPRRREASPPPRREPSPPPRREASPQPRREVELRPRTDATIQLDENDDDVEMLNPRRSRRVTPESLNTVGQRAGDLGRAAREARARAHATGEIKSVPPDEEKTTLASDNLMVRLRGDSRKAEKQSKIKSELAEASEDGQTRIHSPLGAWAGLAKLE